jgi:hypothetical protein
VAEELKDCATVEVPPTLEGRNMSMILVPLRPGKKAAGEVKKEGGAEEEKKEEKKPAVAAAAPKKTAK